jgi:hypothetical protein
MKLTQSKEKSKKLAARQPGRGSGQWGGVQRWQQRTAADNSGEMKRWPVSMTKKINRKDVVAAARFRGEV